jgi:hypothetical protein
MSEISLIVGKNSTVDEKGCVESNKHHLPNDQTSDLWLYLFSIRTSGADHLTGNLVPALIVYSSSVTNLNKLNNIGYVFDATQHNNEYQ